MKFKDLQINDLFIFPDGKFIWKKVSIGYARSEVELVERYVDPNEEVIIEGAIETKWQQNLEKN